MRFSIDPGIEDQDLDERCAGCGEQAEVNGLCETCEDRRLEDQAMLGIEEDTR